MSFTVEPDAARLTVALDVRHPLAYLALHPTLAFGETHGIEIDWLPVEVPPLKEPSTPAADDDRSIRHRRARALAIAREIATYGAAQGLVLRDPYRAGPADAVNLGWLWVREHARERLPAFLTDVFDRYWSGALDPSSVAETAERVEAAGAPAGFGEWCAADGPAAAAALAGEIRELGLVQAPTYAIDDEIFWGRQHLPMIAWILGGRTGPIPI